MQDRIYENSNTPLRYRKIMDTVDGLWMFNKIREINILTRANALEQTFWNFGVPIVRPDFAILTIQRQSMKEPEKMTIN